MYVLLLYRYISIKSSLLQRSVVFSFVEGNVKTRTAGINRGTFRILLKFTVGDLNIIFFFFFFFFFFFGIVSP